MFRKRSLIVVFILCVAILMTSCSSQEVTYQTPIIKRETNLGADLPQVLYESEKELIFSHYLGIFIFDLENSKILAAIHIPDDNLKVGTQGDTTSIVQVDDTKETITIHNVGSEELDYYYEYDIGKDKLFRYPIEELDIEIRQIEDTGSMVTSNWTAWDLKYESEIRGKEYYPFRDLIE